MSTIFLSHSSKDNAIAKEIELRLVKQGHTSVFLDLDPEKGIVAGKSWERTLYRKLRACSAIIAVCTDDYLRSHWCFAEIALARMEGKHIFALKAEPLSSNAKLPSILSETQYIDLRSNLEDAYRRLWRGLDEIDLLGVSRDWDPKKAPYLGLNTFQEKHAPLFFGREEESRAGVELLERGSPGLIMTLGSSGTGKSSLVLAGMLPRLRRNPERWLIVEPFRPGLDPYHELASSIMATYRRYAPDSTGKLGNTEVLSSRLQNWSPENIAGASLDLVECVSEDERVKRLLNQLSELHHAPPSSAGGSFINFLDWSLDDLRRIVGVSSEIPSTELFSGNTPIIDIARDLRRVSGRTDATVLVVVDQFEELLGSERNNKRCIKFLEMLRYSIEMEDSPVTVLGTMRSDFLSLFQRTSALRGIDFKNISLGPMKLEGMRNVIEQPAKLGAIELETGLVDRLIADTETPDALPLLSFTLWALWRDFRNDGRIEISEYERIGGLQGGIAREADALFKKDNEGALKRAFISMARLNDKGAFARQPVAWDSPELTPVHTILEQFEKRRLLVFRDDDGKRFVEVAHEALFRSWKLLTNWLDQSRAEILLKQQISHDAQTWVDAQHDEDSLWRGARLQQATALLKSGKLDGVGKEFIALGLRRIQKRRQLLAATVMTVFFSMAGLTVWAVIERTDAIDAKTKLSEEYQQMVAEILPIAWNNSMAIGKLDLLASNKLDNINRVGGIGPGNALAILQHYGKGRVIVISHEGFLGFPGTNEKSARSSKFLLKVAVKWATHSSPSKIILSSAGHCEVKTVGSKFVEYQLPEKTIKKLGFSIASIQDLTDTSRLTNSSLLIIGNAWSDFSQQEIESVKNFVLEGGSLLLAGLRWSFEGYKDSPNKFNPCTFHPSSDGKFPSQGSYPMNHMANIFGIEFMEGVITFEDIQTMQ